MGGFTTTVRGKRIYLIEAAEKGMAWMKLTARGNAGHGSMINHHNAVTELAGAVARIGAHQWPVRLTPAMEVLLASVADIAGTEATPENAEALVSEFESSARMLGAVIRNTANPTMLNAGYKVNVIPTEATAHIDGRFLPGFEDEFFATLAELCGEHVTWEFVSKQQPWDSPYDGQIVDAMTQSILAEDPTHRRALPHVGRHGCQALPQARHDLLRVRPSPVAAGPRLRGALPRRRRAGPGRRTRVRGPGLDKFLDRA